MTHEFCDHCPGCQPAIVDPVTGAVLPPTSDYVKAVMHVWRKETTYAQRKAYIDVTVHNSRVRGTLELAQEVVKKFEAAIRDVRSLEEARAVDSNDTRSRGPARDSTRRERLMSALTTDADWRIRVYRFLSQEGPVEKRQLQCVIDLPLDDRDGLQGRDLRDCIGSIEPASQEPAKTLGQLRRSRVLLPRAVLHEMGRVRNLKWGAQSERRASLGKMKCE